MGVDVWKVIEICVRLPTIKLVLNIEIAVIKLGLAEKLAFWVDKHIKLPPLSKVLNLNVDDGLVDEAVITPVTIIIS